jgi:hypothetical protein
MCVCVCRDISWERLSNVTEWVRFPAEAVFFSPTHPDAPRPTHAPYRMDTRSSFSPGVKLPEREAKHLPPYSVKVKDAWSFTLTPPIQINSVVLTHKEGFIFALHVRQNLSKTNQGLSRYRFLS